jgi:hypothetical protein
VSWAQTCCCTRTISMNAVATALEAMRVIDLLEIRQLFS